MEYQAPKSTCRLCGSNFTRKGMTRHLKSCIPKNLGTVSNKRAQHLIHLHVQDTFNADYFLHILLAEEAPLGDVDAFFRQVWLECCGHMSAFSFERYGDEIDMAYAVGPVFESGRKVTYQYDFGSTTELSVKGVGWYRGTVADEIQILARNAQPVIPCDECRSKPAVTICTECAWDDEGWLCEECVKNHECDDEMFLPVVNSPRTGVCGYTGESLLPEAE